MPEPKTKPVFEEPDDTDSPDRLISLSDGIFGFAMTLLAINVALPAVGSQASQQEVTEHVFSMVPEFIVFATSFLLVGLYWIIHRRTFRYITHVDNALTWLNLLQLMFVAFLPVATGLFDTYPEVAIVGLLYGSTLVAIGVTGQLLWRHATGHRRLVKPDLDPEYVRYFKFRGETTLTIFILFTIVTVIVPDYGRWVLILLLLVYPFMVHAYRFLRKHNIIHIESPKELPQ